MNINSTNIPLTGEKPINGWIIVAIVVAALALVATLLAPKIPAIIDYFKNKFKK